jgi:hypothetical protein
MQSESVPDSNQKLNLFSFSADRLAPGFFCKFLLHCLENIQKLKWPSEKSLPLGSEGNPQKLRSFPDKFSSEKSLPPVGPEANPQKLRSYPDKSLPFGLQIFAVCLGVDSWFSSFLRSVFVQNNAAAVENEITLTESDITVENDVYLDEDDIYFNDDDSFEYLL